jgi:hypothetical protein
VSLFKQSAVQESSLPSAKWEFVKDRHETNRSVDANGCWWDFTHLLIEKPSRVELDRGDGRCVCENGLKMSWNGMGINYRYYSVNVMHYTLIIVRVKRILPKDLPHKFV